MSQTLIRTSAPATASGRSLRGYARSPSEVDAFHPAHGKNSVHRHPHRVVHRNDPDGRDDWSREPQPKRWRATAAAGVTAIASSRSSSDPAPTERLPSSTPDFRAGDVAIDRAALGRSRTRKQSESAKFRPRSRFFGSAMKATYSRSDLDLAFGKRLRYSRVSEGSPPRYRTGSGEGSRTERERCQQSTVHETRGCGDDWVME